MTKVEILKNVLILIQTDKEKYICDALREVLDEEWTDEVDKNVSDLKKWINELLEGCGTLEGWLSRKGHDIRDAAKVKAIRVAWVNWMIEQWEQESKPICNQNTKFADIGIGSEFSCGGKLWRCTDKGTRTIVAICISENDDSWHVGPPYAVAETVFDEDSINGIEEKK